MGEAWASCLPTQLRGAEPEGRGAPSWGGLQAGASFLFLLLPEPPSPEPLLDPGLWAVEQLASGCQTPLWLWRPPVLKVLLGAFSAVHGQLWFSWFRIHTDVARAGFCLHLYAEGVVPPLLPMPAGAEKEG